ncbi:MAG: alpha/beta hydrolase [Gaiellales bacterium]
MPHVRVNDCDLYYEESGTGRPVLFVHGLWLSSRFFHRQLTSFAARSRTVVVDLRGHGRSERTGAGHTVAQHARDLAAFCEALELRDVVIAGWSMGSLVTWELIRQLGPDGIRGMVVIDQSPSDLRWPDWPDGPLDVPTLHHLHSAVQEQDPELPAAFIRLLFKDEPAPDELAWMAAEVAQIPPGIAAPILFEQTVVDYRELLPQLTIPTLLCIGRVEGIVTVAAGEYMRDRIPGAELVIFEESNHVPFLEETERFDRVVGDWIARLP